MKQVTVRNSTIGEGIPKICLPIVGDTQKEILETARELLTLPFDLLEWRLDWYEDCFVFEKVKATLRQLRQILGETPLLVTFRTAQEGGKKEISEAMYGAVVKEVIKTKEADLIDLELFFGEKVLLPLLEMAKQYNVKTVLSNHDFEKTPDKEEIIKRLCEMQSLGGDITKIAVMPKTKKDVLTLLSATEAMESQYADRPFITMSMAGEGCISRIAGEFFGSAVTFGAGKKSSAPGQIPAKKLEQVLQTLHESISGI